MTNLDMLNAAVGEFRKGLPTASDETREAVLALCILVRAAIKLGAMMPSEVVETIASDLEQP
jgi:hypothetical protein